MTDTCPICGKVFFNPWTGRNSYHRSCVVQMKEIPWEYKETSVEPAPNPKWRTLEP